ncbi:protein SAAL1 isoform X2 [Echinops telfairi]|uniref:Protein SAAL1 isoform X2 n=1 Tax=Echinops telfairi TaxID=9371 RepID=A0AC55D5B5_ECHTE|nr:protein SAAL1 isoform X2 [Echinops telfairi]
MDRNPSPPPLSREEEEDEKVARGDCVGSTVYSKHWLFGVLSGLIQAVNPEDSKSGPDEEQKVELDEELENDICRIWDMSMDEDVALFLQEFNTPGIFMGVLAKSKCSRLREICVGILGNMACFQEICVSISNDKNLGQVLLHCLYDSDPPTLLEISRLLLTCLSQTEVAHVWVGRIQEYPSIYDSICFIMASSTNVDLLVKIGEVVDKLFDLDEKLMLEWIGKGRAQPGEHPQPDSEEQQVCRLVPCVLEAAKQVRSENLDGLDVYMHILQLLTTVDDGIQAIVECPDTGKDTWNLLFDLVCHEFCQSGDPPIIFHEQKMVLASVFSVMSTLSASRGDQDYLEMEKAFPLIDSLTRVLQMLQRYQKKPENSNGDETEKPDLKGDDLHWNILKDISCEFLSNILQALTKEAVAQGLKEGHLNQQKCSCAVKNLLPSYSPVVADFLKVLHDVDKTLADDLKKSFPSLKDST